jgi:hypothetical protein
LEQKHRDLIAKIAMTAEPSRLFRFWRSTLRDAQPETASVIIKKQKVRFDRYDTGFLLEPVMRSERKRADLCPRKAFSSDPMKSRTPRSSTTYSGDGSPSARKSLCSIPRWPLWKST